MDLKYVLSLEAHVMNATPGKNGLSPCILVFGISPKVPTNGKEYLEHRRRIEAVQTARSEILKVITRQRLATALKMNVLRHRDITFGYDVLLYKEHTRNEWIGPYKVLASNKKNLFLSIIGVAFPVSIEKVKPYANPHYTKLPNTPLRDINTEMDRVIFGESFLVSLRKGISNVEQQTLPRRGDITVTHNDILATEVIHPNDERSNSKIFDKAKKNEIRGLNRRNTWSIVNNREVPRDANVIGVDSKMY